MANTFITAAVIAAIAPLSACTEESARKVRAEYAVKAILNDPDSATFSDVQVGKTDQHVCGNVNARNRMGGYVGAKPFVYKEFSPKNGFALIVDGPPSNMDFKMLKMTDNKHEQFKRLEAMCMSVEHWNEGCAKYPMESHKLCKDTLAKDFEKIFMAIYGL